MEAQPDWRAPCLRESALLRLLLLFGLLVLVAIATANCLPASTEDRADKNATQNNNSPPKNTTTQRPDVSKTSKRPPNTRKPKRPDADRTTKRPENRTSKRPETNPNINSNLTIDGKQSQKNACGWYRPRGVNRIAGGYPASLSEYPSFARLIINFGYSSVSCGGTIISPLLILTAQHCLRGQNGRSKPSSIQVKVGSVDAYSGTALVGKQICLPRSAGNFMDTDVAIIVLAQKIQFNDKVQPACLPKGNINYGSQAHVVGFGLTGKVPFYQRPKQLQVLPVVKSQRCPFSVARNAVCFISNTKFRGDACEGKLTSELSVRG